MASNSAVRGLSPAELDTIRDALAAGRRPKVVFTEAAGQIAGQQGQVVELTDPQASDEWVVVRFGRDELPFSPTDLAVAPKGAAAKRPAPPKPADSGPPQAPGAPLLPPVDAAPARPAAAVSDTGLAVTQPATANAPAAKTPAKAAARKAGRVKPPATLTVTVSYAEGEWMVAAQQGSKILAKPYLISAAEALKMVGMLDVPGVHEAVAEIVAAARAEAEAAAERLRAELADVEARLAELRAAT